MSFWEKNQQQASPLALGAQHISRQGQFLRCPIVQVFKRNLQRMDNIFSSSLSAVASATPTCKGDLKGDLIPHIKTSPSMSSQTLGPITRYQSSTKGRWWRSNCCWSTTMILRWVPEVPNWVSTVFLPPKDCPPPPPKKDSKMSNGLCEAPPPPIPSLRASSPYWSYKSRFSGSLNTS